VIRATRWSAKVAVTRPPESRPPCGAAVKLAANGFSRLLSLSAVTASAASSLVEARELRVIGEHRLPIQPVGVGFLHRVNVLSAPDEPWMITRGVMAWRQRPRRRRRCLRRRLRR